MSVKVKRYGFMFFMDRMHYIFKNTTNFNFKQRNQEIQKYWNNLSTFDQNHIIGSRLLKKQLISNT